MFEYNITEENGIKWISLSGRIDSVSAQELETPFKELTASGERQIAVSFEEVTYISSAGLRVFLIFQKQLKKVGGEILLYKMADHVLNLFKISGLDKLFRIINEKEEILLPDDTKEKDSDKAVKEIKGIRVKVKDYDAGPGLLFPAGSSDNLMESTYTKKHVVSLRPEDISFGTGLAALGETYEDYKNYFGEAIVINNNLFVYPAIKRSSVDFMTYSREGTHVKYHFLHGFGFKGSFRHILSFESTQGFIPLPDLIDTFSGISRSNLTGIVFLAESKGLWGMHLKKIPLMENKPSNGEDIFSFHNFPEWMNFSIEPEDINQVVLATGIAIKDKNKEKSVIVSLFPEESNFHIHACVFQQELFNRDPDEFQKETGRVIREMKALNIKHLLGKSCFSYGIAGIVELEG